MQMSKGTSIGCFLTLDISFASLSKGWEVLVDQWSNIYMCYSVSNTDTAQ